ncbi:DUF72 domain-containing protein [Granulicella arctica]|uniref:DUF72 domain-containing protein n=1 Tax=Granulicella arctica TaxID=940613 RepID=UPI0021DFC2D6|nr:DUF72 domain-containing protein [Granulicella arctica]
MTSSLRIGTAGWSIPSRFGSDVPGEGTHLERYARAFRCCEIDSSFYKPHRLATWAKWAASVPEHFRFSVKAPKTITHEGKLACSPELLKTFLEQVTTLDAKLGPLLFQLPPKFAFELASAEAFMVMLRDLHPGPVVFEPRHPTWFTAEVSELFRRFHIALVAADPTSIPEATYPGGWEALVYYRLHGSPRVYYSAYEDGRLVPLATDMKARQKNADVWCIFDNTASGAALGDARRLQQLTE